VYPLAMCPLSPLLCYRVSPLSQCDATQDPLLIEDILKSWMVVVSSDTLDGKGKVIPRLQGFQKKSHPLQSGRALNLVGFLEKWAQQQGNKTNLNDKSLMSNPTEPLSSIPCLSVHGHWGG
jgi:hypothetical protein